MDRLYLKPVRISGWRATPLLFACLFTHFSFGATVFWTAPLPSNWNNTANWSATSGGAGGAAVPVAGDSVIFNAGGAGNCLVDIPVAIGSINVSGYTGTININGQAFVISGTKNNIFSSGTINDLPGTSVVSVNTTGITTFSGTTFGASVNIVSGQLFLNGSVFNNATTLEKNGATDNLSSGNNTYNGTTA